MWSCLENILMSRWYALMKQQKVKEKKDPSSGSGISKGTGRAWNGLLPHRCLWFQICRTREERVQMWRGPQMRMKWRKEGRMPQSGRLQQESPGQWQLTWSWLSETKLLGQSSFASRRPRIPEMLLFFSPLWQKTHQFQRKWQRGLQTQHNPKLQSSSPPCLEAEDDSLLQAGFREMIPTADRALLRGKNVILWRV